MKLTGSDRHGRHEHTQMSDTLRTGTPRPGDTRAHSHLCSHTDHTHTSHTLSPTFHTLTDMQRHTHMLHTHIHIPLRGKNPKPADRLGIWAPDRPETQGGGGHGGNPQCGSRGSSAALRVP